MKINMQAIDFTDICADGTFLSISALYCESAAALGVSPFIAQTYPQLVWITSNP
jgi:ABC-type uncharacterized transport system permease subunit